MKIFLYYKTFSYVPRLFFDFFLQFFLGIFLFKLLYISFKRMLMLIIDDETENTFTNNQPLKSKLRFEDPR